MSEPLRSLLRLRLLLLLKLVSRSADEFKRREVVMRQLTIGLVLGVGLAIGTALAQLPPMPPMSTGNQQLDQMNQQM